MRLYAFHFFTKEHQKHLHMERRKFLKNSALASTAFMVPSFLKGYVNENGARSRSGKVLVVVQLSGGNDGLNTVIPYGNDIYYKSRPTLAIPKQKVIKLNDELGWNPNLKALRSIYDQGQMSILNSVGYPNPDRSHFRSMDIWHTASDSSEFLSSGWIGRYLDNHCSGCDIPHYALEMDDTLTLALKGIEHSGFAVGDINRLKKTNDNQFLKTLAQAPHEEEENVAYLYKTMIDTQSSANYLHKKSRVHKSKVNYPRNGFAKDLKQISELITADSDTRIYYVTLSGFDTHANQQNQQGRLLKQYAEAMAAFVKDLKQNNLLDDTLIMTFSEFGRRVKQNGSRGTDHGTANNVFLMGGNLRKKGFYNDAPDLANLDKGDLKYQIDFRSIYANILEDWLGAKSSGILGINEKVKVI